MGCEENPRDRFSLVPVGHYWKFDLEKTFSLDFGVKGNFSKNRIEHVMFKFLATTENIRTRVELSYFWQETESNREWTECKFEWTRVNLRWKGGQPKLPIGPDQKLIS